MQPKLKTASLCLVLLLAFTTKAQVNLVPNGGFEDAIACPSTIGQADYANGWTILSKTPDYLHACSTTTSNCFLSGQIIAGTPLNCFGFQYPASGNAYHGFYTFAENDQYKEIIGAQLSSPLIIGQKYFVKFKLAFTLMNISNAASDKAGIRFSTVPHHSLTAPPPINNFAHVYATSIITDTLNWTTVFKSFVADSNYNFVEIGNFFTDANINLQVMRDQGVINASYYYFDDLCVSLDSLYSLNYGQEAVSITENSLLLGNINIYPNPLIGNLLSFDIPLKNGNLFIYNVFGNLVFAKYLADTQQVLIDLPAGIYFLRLQNPRDSIHKKLIIQH